MALSTAAAPLLLLQTPQQQQGPSLALLRKGAQAGGESRRALRCVCSASVPGESAGGLEEEAVSRRRVLQAASTASASLLLAAGGLGGLAQEAKAAGKGAPKGYTGHVDSVDNYAFFFPFGWQEISVKGQDVVFKDVIEPLENVSVNIVKTDKADLAELGSPTEVAQALVERVLSSPTQQISLLNAAEREVDGKKYYTFEFLAKAPNYTRHALGTVAVAYGKFYTLTTGANERRWSKMEPKLRSVAESFITL